MKINVTLDCPLELKEDDPTMMDNDEALFKEWLWTHRKDEILSSMNIVVQDKNDENDDNNNNNIDTSSSSQQQSASPNSRLDLLDTISKVQRQYLQREEPQVVFGCLLEGLLSLMKSEYGFIGEVKSEKDKNNETRFYLQTHAITNIAWNAATQAFYQDNVEGGLKFYNMNSLFGHVIVHQEPVISNTPFNDPRKCGIPDGHPALNHFLGVPFFDHHHEKHNMIGMVGIANKPGGYQPSDVEFLEPLVVTCSNLIQAYAAMQENKHLINTLEEKVHERTQELKMSNRNLEQANRKVVQASAAQLRHFACMSHEIRTPLNCIIGLSSLLRDTEPLTEMQRDSLRMIITSGELLCTVVNDVLDFSKLTSGNVAMDVRPTSLQEMLDSVVPAIAYKASNDEKQLDFVVRYDPWMPEWLETDGRRLSQVLFNLLGNALKFSHERGRVQFTVELHPPILNTMEESLARCGQDDGGSAVEKDKGDDMSLGRVVPQHDAGNDDSIQNGETQQCPFHSTTTTTRSSACSSVLEEQQPTECGKYIRFIVKDWGKGIDSNDFDKIFEPFQQANVATERVYGGTGLGLAITSRLVNTLGGTISVDSILGEWSEFKVEIPLNGAHANVHAIREGLANAQILHVHNSDREKKLDPRMLETYGIPLHEFESCNSLYDWFATTKGTDPAGCFYFCLVQEELYQSDVFEQIIRKAVPNSMALLTFGPKYSVKEARRHYRSLPQILPSVLMQSMLSCMEEMTNSSADVAVELEPEPIPYCDIQALIAEDNVINQKVLDRMLKRIGVQHVDIADNGKIAVDRCSEKDYDIVFMDMQMPVMDGIEACRIIVSRRQERQTPKVVFVTAHVSSSFESSAMEAGGDGFISKPFNLDKIESFFQSIHR